MSAFLMLSINGNQHIRHSLFKKLNIRDTHHNKTFKLSLFWVSHFIYWFAQCLYAEYNYAGWCYSDWCGGAPFREIIFEAILAKKSESHQSWWNKHGRKHFWSNLKLYFWQKKPFRFCSQMRYQIWIWLERTFRPMLNVISLCVVASLPRHSAQWHSALRHSE